MKLSSKLLRAACKMPELDHWPGRDGGERYGIMKSQVARWLVEQPELVEWLFRSVARSNHILFDSVNRKWIGLSNATQEVLARRSEYGRLKDSIEKQTEAKRGGRKPVYQLMDMMVWINSNEGCKTARWQKGMAEKGMSRSAFFRHLKPLMESGKVQRFEGRWIVGKPAIHPLAMTASEPASSVHPERL